MVLASGTTLLNDDGSISLDDDGVELVSDGISDCDCCESTCVDCGDIPLTLDVSWFAGSWGWTSPFLLPCTPDDNSMTIVNGGGECVWATGGQCIGGATMGGSQLYWTYDLHSIIPAATVGSSGWVMEFGGPQTTVYFYRETASQCDVYGTYPYGGQAGAESATSPPAGVVVTP